MAILTSDMRIKMNPQEEEMCFWFIKKMKDIDLENQIFHKGFSDFMDSLVKMAGEDPKKKWGIDTKKGEIYEVKPEVKQNGNNSNLNNT